MGALTPDPRMQIEMFKRELCFLLEFMPDEIKNNCFQALVDMLVIASPDAKICAEFEVLLPVSLAS